MERKKIPLLLVPGLLSNEKVWQHQIQNLDDIASVSVAMTTKDSTPETMVATLLSQAPPKFVLAGHSMGGWLALEIMRRAPERVSKLCLLNTSARLDSSEKLAKRREMLDAVSKGKFSPIADQIAELLVFRKSIKPEVLKMFLEVGKTAFICQENAMIQRDNCVQLLSKIRVPTLVIHAQEDRNFSLDDHEELALLIPKAKLQIIPNSGHMSPMETPEAVTSLLREWLL